MSGTTSQSNLRQGPRISQPYGRFPSLFLTVFFVPAASRRAIKYFARRAGLLPVRTDISRNLPETRRYNRAGLPSRAQRTIKSPRERKKASGSCERFAVRNLARNAFPSRFPFSLRAEPISRKVSDTRTTLARPSG